MINVTKSFLPPKEEYQKYLDGIWERVHLTNQGPLVTELEQKLKDFLKVPHFFFLSNGTIAIQLAIKALDLKGEIITTPFSYVATTSSIVWENAKPVFADIDPLTLTIDPDKIEQAITPLTSAILATHVYGIPCNVEAIEKLATKYNLKVIYDAAHAFGVYYKGRSLLSYGNVSTLSFHATKLFHTVEGGAVVTNDADSAHKLSYLRNFGHNGQEAFWGLGINGKNSEFHAAMGLCVLPYFDEIVNERKKISDLYDNYWKDQQIELQRPLIPKDTVYNYSYYPVLFQNERELLRVKEQLNKEAIYPRRYFYPSLNKLPYANQSTPLPVSETISERVLCLPLYHGLTSNEAIFICEVIAQAIKQSI
jgi:dTDP-4-amino-4,6-dideoxygalactose transaminase